MTTPRSRMRRHSTVAAFLTLGAGLVLTVHVTLSRTAHMAEAQRETRIAICEDRNDRDQMIAESLVVIADEAGVPRHVIEPVLDALAPRACKEIYAE